MTAAIEPINRISVVEAIAERLRARILRGEWTEGETLRQEAIAETYGVSRMPVREALRQLESEGLIVFHPHRGAVVAGLEIAEIEELFDLRRLVESELIRLAVPRAGSADLAAARTELTEMEAAYEAHDTHRWGELNWAFHKALYAPSGRHRTIAFVQTINSNVDRYVRLQLSLTSQSIANASREHHELLDRYAAGDAEGCAALLARHIDHARDDLLTALAENAPGPPRG